MLWIVYCVLHSVLASEWIKQTLHRNFKAYRWYRLFYTVFAFIFLVVIIYCQIQMRTIELFQRGNFVFVVGIITLTSGLFLMLVCIRKYFMNLSGLRSLAIEDFSNELQITGVHKYVRHPLYLGTFIFIWGLFLIIPQLSMLIANVIITVYTLIGIEIEERKLLAEFGDDYRLYRQTVPKLVPFPKLKREQ
ncbi:MAG TPA: isoprenylcysteine carboxylmethyltransferase family protein [Flavisolibacter sp.]|nr:isoprenylcysteine carboxylmethyltransferase family protein [Flavisolibacter sp.]